MEKFDPDLLYAVHDVARLMRLRFDQRARTFGMTRAQGVILLKLQLRPGMTQNDMACILEVEPITVARLVDRLEASGFVERRSDPNDRRVHRLHLLPAAEPILAQIADYREQVHAEITEGLDPEAWDATLKVLKHMKHKLTAESAGARRSTPVGEHA